MVSSPRQCLAWKGKCVDNSFVRKNMIPIDSVFHLGGSQDDRCVDCHDWTEEGCKDVVAYMEKLSAQCEKKERKAKSLSSSSFSGFSPAMPVPLSQLSSVTGVVSTSASSTTVCAVTYAFAGPAVSAVPSSSAVPVVPRHGRDSSTGGLLGDLHHQWERFLHCSHHLSPLLLILFLDLRRRWLFRQLRCCLLHHIWWYCHHSAPPSGTVPGSLPDPVQSRLHWLSWIHHLEVPEPVPSPIPDQSNIWRPPTNPGLDT